MTPTIAIICNTALHVQRARMTLISALQGLGARIVLISPHDPSVAELERAGVVHHHVEINQYGHNPLEEAVMFFRLRAGLRRHRPFLCLCYTIKANTIGSLAACSLGIPVVNNIAGRGRAFDGAGWLKRHLFISLYALSLRRSARVFFQNRDDLQFFRDNAMVDETLARRLPGSGVDLNRFRDRPDLPQVPTFLFLGRLLISKGAGMFIGAARALDALGVEARFVLAGERLDEKGYVSIDDLKTFKAQGNCRYLGQVAPDRVGALLQDSSFLVLPSSYGEGVPRTLLEAGATGRPVITTDSVGCRDVVRHRENGLQIPPNDPEALVAAMQEAAAMDAATLRRLGRASRVNVERNFDERIVIDAYLEICRRHWPAADGLTVATQG
ncbi:MAG: glycosyltransferase family 4 protein [Silicimonas sp.]|nr:glycosyltransferase family 4 protein [Silicimonas sp.]